MADNLDTTNGIDQTSAPAYLGRDSYSGKWSLYRVPAGQRDSAFTAAEVAAVAAEGVIWQFSGHLRDGRPLYCRTRYVADAGGRLHLYDSTGRKVLIHPAARTIRVLAS